MRPGSVAPSCPSVTSRLPPLRRGPAPGPPFPSVPLRFPEGRAVQPCLRGLWLPPGGRARAPMEEPLALHPVKLYVYDLSKGMARRLSPLMLGKSTAGAPGPPRPPPPGGLAFCRRPPRPGFAAPGSGAAVAVSCPGGGGPRPVPFS